MESDQSPETVLDEKAKNVSATRVVRKAAGIY
jgi:hypothetical protein